MGSMRGVNIAWNLKGNVWFHNVCSRDMCTLSFSFPAILSTKMSSQDLSNLQTHTLASTSQQNIQQEAGRILHY